MDISVTNLLKKQSEDIHDVVRRMKEEEKQLMVDDNAKTSLFAAAKHAIVDKNISKLMSIIKVIIFISNEPKNIQFVLSNGIIKLIYDVLLLLYYLIPI